MLSVSKMSRDEGSQLEDVSNSNHDGSPPKELIVEDEAVENVYYKDEGMEVDIFNTMPSPGLESMSLSFETVSAILLSTLKTCEQVKQHLLWVPYIDFVYGFLY